MDSVQLADVIKSNGTGNINLFKDLTAAELESFRADNLGRLVFAVDVNEDASGTESSTSQGIALESVTLTVTYSDGSEVVIDSLDDCCFTETIALLAKSPSTSRELYYTLIGESGSSRITANNVIQERFDSSLKIDVSTPFVNADTGVVATSAVLIVSLLDTNTSLGDPEAFYDYSNGFEDLALLNVTDTAYLDDYAAGREEAPAVILTNPPPGPDPLAVETWNYLPSASTYYLVGYEDKYPVVGDYDFNDLTVAYRVGYGLNVDGLVVSIQGAAYLLTRGAAYTHNWHLRVDLPPEVGSSVTCTTYPDPGDGQVTQPCSPDNPATTSGTVDMVMFDDTGEIFVDPFGSTFVNTYPGQPFMKGPKSTFGLEFDAPVDQADIGPAPFDPYLYVRNTGETIQLLEVNPDFKDENGYPFGMLMPIDWEPPLEYIDMETAFPMFGNFVSCEHPPRLGLGLVVGQVVRK
jgi:LruC domain-containing protein